MGLLSEVSAAGMNPDQATQMLGWVNSMLSKNLRPQERERFSGAKQYLESYLANQRRNEVGGLLSELMQRQNPNTLLGEGLSRGPGIPEGIFPPEDTAPDLIHPDDYRKAMSSIIRNIQPNPYATADRLAIDPDKFDPSRRRYGGI